MTRSLKLLCVPPVLLACTACLSLDFMFLDAPQVDAYELDPDLIPPELVELVTFDRGDGTQLAGLWARQDATTPSPPLVYFHGTSNNLSTSFPRIAYYWGWGGYDVFAPEYSGYGTSEGDASWANLTDLDGHAALTYVSETTGVPIEEIPVVSLSLGGFVALHTLDDLPAQSLVMQSVFANSDLLLDTSLRIDVPPGWFFGSDWENDRAISKIDSPVFVVHGLDDDFIDPRSGAILYAAANEPKELWQPEGVDHSDLPEVLPDEFEQRATEFIESFRE